MRGCRADNSDCACGRAGRSGTMGARARRNTDLGARRLPRFEGQGVLGNLACGSQPYPFHLDAPAKPREACSVEVELREQTLARLKFRLHQAPFVAQRVVTHPRWFLELAGRRLRDRTVGNRQRLSPAVRRQYVATQEEALSAILRVSPDELASASRDIWIPDRRLAITDFGASNKLLKIIGIIVRIVRPTVVVEIGVAEGYSTAVILRTLTENGRGHLHSIDLPIMGFRPDDFIGRVVSDDLKTRWSLTLGPSRHLLPELAERVAPIDLSLHDGDQSFLSRMEEQETLWPCLRAGGILLSNPVTNPALIEFGERVGARPWLIHTRDDDLVGLLRRD